MIILQHLSPQFIMHHKYINAQVKSVFIIFNIEFIPEACQGFIFGGQNKRGCRITSEGQTQTDCPTFCECYAFSDWISEILIR